MPTPLSTALYSGNKLTTGGNLDPLYPKLVKAINHATHIDISVSFIQPSGLTLLFEPLLDAIIQGAKIRILTSDYLAITHPDALRKLMLLAERSAQCRVFCCDSDASFHMKSYIFIRAQLGQIVEGCAWIGSNNISKMALTEGHEWTLRHDYQSPDDSAEALDFANIRQQFGQVFFHQQTTELCHAWIDSYQKVFDAAKPSRLALVGKSVDDEQTERAAPNSAQELALMALRQSRAQGFKRGLVVLATGMGKTWLAAFDALQIKAKRVLFVAHREEILIQAEKTFSTLLPKARTGLYNGNVKAEQVDLLFASIASLSKDEQLRRFNPGEFDYVVVDEFHHACAKSYRSLLAYFEPRFLLGLTATPERSDQADILSLCDNNLVFERNLVHGIESQILVPFCYYGIFDTHVDYQEIPWRNGKFDPHKLEFAFATKRRSAHILAHWQEKRQTRTLGFCVSTAHADYMATTFSDAGIKAIAVYSGSTIRRNEALARLAAGEIEVIFSVDLFNEGTDLPSIDTVLMIRPTESKILFLQQLGRGLRQSQATAKTNLVVLDFIGNHQSFLNRPQALLGAYSLESVSRHLASPQLATGCYVNFDPELIAFWETLGKRYRASAEEDYEALAQQLSHRPSATEFFQAGFDLAKVRAKHQSWFDLVAKKEADENLKTLLDTHRQFLLKGVEITAMNKCYKPILLEAFLELDGFRTPPTLAQLAERSHKVLARRPDLMRTELPENEAQLQGTDPAWVSYWNRNPIRHFAKPNKTGEQWFSVDDDKFVANISITETDIPLMHELVQELVDYRLADYIQRKASSKDSNKKISQDDQHTNHADNPLSARDDSTNVIDLAHIKARSGTPLNFYPDLKIACGHFKTGHYERQIKQIVPDGFGNLTSERHFIAKASGNSMNGGKHPIKDGDLLLLEWVSSDSAGSISNSTMAIEIQDAAGDNQYLLRNVRKIAEGEYLLEAQNPDYGPMMATAEMRTFARLKCVLPIHLQTTDVF